MLVRIKKEIIAFGVEGIRPGVRTSPKLSAVALKQWLDEGREIALFDTRNDYEIKLGTFRGAIPAGIDHFRDFPAAVEKLPESMKDRPIVMFCTGGIRCEKAGPYMESQGFHEVYQLDGGILKYFEEVGGAHYEGECFVFDQRVGVDPALRETGSSQCYSCLAPLTAEDQADARFVAGQSCPYCFKSIAEKMADRIACLETAIRKAANPLPGSLPADNFRPIAIPAECDGRGILETLCALFPHIDPTHWRGLFEKNQILSAAREPISPDHRVHAGERYLRKTPADIEPDVNADIRVIHDDEAVLVLDKPAPLPVHSSGRFHRNTLLSILHAACHPLKPRPAHRLDANTSGLIVFTRTRHFAKSVQPQFERGEVEKSYLARIHGHPMHDDFSCDAPIASEPASAGARGIDPKYGLPAKTEFLLLRRDSDGTSLVAARPLTGRTNQIRAHLWHLGHPIVGDPVYLKNAQLGSSQTLHPFDPPMCLHAHRLEFCHPIEKTRVHFESPAPVWTAPR
jgi:RluA family pseudouridine synthase